MRQWGWLARVAAGGAALALTLPLPAADWERICRDDFDRSEPGPAWVIAGEPGCSLGIENGELVGDGKGTIQYAYAVPGDQKVVFKTRWVEGTGASVTQFAGLLKCSSFHGQGTGLALVHGRGSNTSNVVEFMGWNGTLARNRAPLPEPGQSYVFEAAVEGTHCYLKRDGQLLIEAELPLRLEGPQFDRLCFYANDKRIRFDWIEIYRKGEAAPAVRSRCPLPTAIGADGRRQYAGPDPDGALAALLRSARAGQGREALAQVKRLPDPAARLAAVLLLAGEFDFEPYDVLCQAIAAELAAHPELEPAQAAGALSLRQAATMMGIVVHPRSSQSAGYGLYLLPRLALDHPFYDALLFRYGSRMAGGEGGLGALPAYEGRRALAEFLARNPGQPLARMFLGERLPWGDELICREPQAPRWARDLRETHARLLQIFDWWMTVRQEPDGQLGGGWGDDVETLRAIAPVLLVDEACPGARAGLKRLADGAWARAEGGLDRGYSKRLWDVEHSAEPTADTQPLMLLFAPGDPVYVERNLKLLPLARDLWTATAPNGYRYFKSIHMSALAVDSAPERSAHVPYHVRAIKGLTWLAWQGGHREADRLWLELADAWAEATLREAQGKLAGIVPAAVDGRSGQLGTPRANWYRPELQWTYYDLGRVGHTQVFGLLCAAALKTGDAKYMAPIFAAIDQAAAYRPQPGFEPPPPPPGSRDLPSAEWQRAQLYQWHREGLFAPYLLAWRDRSGDHAHDAYLAAVAQLPEVSPLVRFQATGELDRLLPKLEADLEAQLRYNLPLWTSHLERTDTLKRLPGTDTLYPLMTGAWLDWGDSFWPTHVFTWSHANPAWAALTRRLGPREVTARLYSFDPADSAFGLRLWNLPFGRYRLTVTPAAGQPASVQTIELASQGQALSLLLRAGCEYSIQLQGSGE